MAPVLLFDGFDLYDLAGMYRRSGWLPFATSSGLTISNTVFRAGNAAVHQSLQLSNSTSAAELSLVNNFTSVILGVAFKFNTVINPVYQLIGFFDAMAPAIQVVIGATGPGSGAVLNKLAVFSGGSGIAGFTNSAAVGGGAGALGAVTASVPFAWAANHWYYLEVYISIAGTVTIMIDGIQIFTGSLSTNPAGTGAINMVGLFNGYPAGGTVATINYDDLYVICGPTAASFLGPCVVDSSVPTTDGSVLQWTPNSGSNNFSRIADVPEDFDATYIFSSTTNNITTVHHGSFSALSSSIFAVQLTELARKDGGNTRGLLPVIRIGGTNYVGTTGFQLADDYVYSSVVMATRPSDGAGWLASDIGNSEFGVKLV